MPAFDYLPLLEQAVEAFLPAIPTPIPITEPIALVTSFHDVFHRTSTASRFGTDLAETTLFLSRLDTAIDKLSAVRRLHEQCRASLHNALHVPLLGLSTEIMGLIFEYAVGDSRRSREESYYQKVCELGHICSQWQSIARSWTPLFTHVDFNYLEDHTLPIDKWGSGPLDVFWTYPGEAILRRRAPRIRSLGLLLDDAVKLFRNSGSRAFPKLEVLLLKDEDTSGPVDDISHWDLPALRQLAILKVADQCRFFPSITSHLRFLLLQKVPTYILSALLVSLERLEGLELDGVTHHDVNGEGEPTLRVSNSLHHLRIQNGYTWKII